MRRHILQILAFVFTAGSRVWLGQAPQDAVAISNEEIKAVLEETGATKSTGPPKFIHRILNGPSCSGTMVGFTSRQIKEGDIIVIPERVPHGFSGIPDHVTYLSVRPDLKKVLQHGYVNPALAKK